MATAVRTQAAAAGKVFPREATADAAEKQNALNQARTLTAAGPPERRRRHAHGWREGAVGLP